MTIYISLLRGINVGGNKKVPMKDLVQVYEGLGYQTVSSYIQSGNVIFTSTESPEQINLKLAAAIEQRFGFAVDLALRTLAEWEGIIAANPFGVTDGKLLHAVILSGEPEISRFETLCQTERNGEELALVGTCLYLYCPNGYGTTKFSNNFIEKQLKLSATTRNWNTMSKLLELAEASSP